MLINSKIALGTLLCIVALLIVFDMFFYRYSSQNNILPVSNISYCENIMFYDELQPSEPSLGSATYHFAVADVIMNGVFSSDTIAIAKQIINKIHNYNITPLFRNPNIYDNYYPVNIVDYLRSESKNIQLLHDDSIVVSFVNKSKVVYIIDQIDSYVFVRLIWNIRNNVRNRSENDLVVNSKRYHLPQAIIQKTYIVVASQTGDVYEIQSKTFTSEMSDVWVNPGYALEYETNYWE